MPTPSLADLYTATKKQYEFYSDIFPNFNIHPDNYQLMVLTNEDAVKDAIINLIFTNAYERFHNQRVGSNVKKLLFEPASPETQNALQNAIKETIENYEPRASIINIICTASTDLESYIINITFSIKNQSAPINLVIPLIRVR